MLQLHLFLSSHIHKLLLESLDTPPAFLLPGTAMVELQQYNSPLLLPTQQGVTKRYSPSLVQQWSSYNNAFITHDNNIESSLAHTPEIQINKMNNIYIYTLYIILLFLYLSSSFLNDSSPWTPVCILTAGAENPWTTWKALNRLHTQVGRSRLNMLKWGFSNE